jgi:topoisomerase-4 subunit A
MRLRALRKLEEIEIRKTEFDELTKEKGRSRNCSHRKQWQWTISLGRHPRSEESSVRRPRSASAAPVRRHARARPIDLTQAMIEREPVTVVVSEEGLDPGAEGPCPGFFDADLQGRDGLKTPSSPRRRTRFWSHLGGKVFTLGGDKLPGGRGHRRADPHHRRYGQ